VWTSGSSSAGGTLCSSGGIFEARLLGCLIADPRQLTRPQAEALAATFESWADCDGACIHLIRKTPFAHQLAVDWSRRRREFVRRAAFSLMATLAVHDREASDAVFQAHLERVVRAATDERNGVKKAVNWALRQIGKRSRRLRVKAQQAAERIHRIDSPAARWIARDALREFRRVPAKE
jgi:3-methyladenine DNA glycosylase AlkD